MTSLSVAVRSVVNDLTELKIRFAFVGALAIGARGRIRQTLDAYIAVSLSNKDEAQKLVEDLLVRGYGINNLYESNSSVALVRLFAPGDQDKADLVNQLIPYSTESDLVKARELISLIYYAANNLIT